MKFPPYTPLIVAGVLFFILHWLRAGGGGRVGRAVRWSDWHSWRMAVEEKEQELAELKAHEPRKPT